MSNDPTAYLTIDGRPVVITHVNPPIPIRWYDYRASLANGDEHSPSGWGKTAWAALKDLETELEEQTE